jgi:hypothetical protein
MKGIAVRNRIVISLLKRPRADHIPGAQKNELPVSHFVGDNARKWEGPHPKSYWTRL